MTVTMDRVPTPGSATEQTATRPRRRRWRLVVLAAVFAVAGTALAVGLSRGPSTPAPPGLTWYWNQTFAEGGFPQHPPGWNIMWGQGTPTQTYTAADHCALEVTGRPELITVPCNGGSWHWTGSAAEHPAAEFLVVGGGQATLFPVN